jgi:hypothetical protein
MENKLQYYKKIEKEEFQDKFLELSSIIESAPYVLNKVYEQRLVLAYNSTKGQSSSSSKSSNSSSHSASGSKGKSSLEKQVLKL